MAQVTSVICHAVDLARCCTALTTQAVSPVVLDAVRRSTTSTMRQRVLDDLVGHLREHRHAAMADHSCSPGAGVLRDGVGPLAATAGAGPAQPLPDDAELLSSLTRAWDDAAPREDLEATVAAGRVSGVDAELVCWEVISVESLDHVGLIRKEASKLVRKLPHTMPDDLMGYGWAGLRAALRQFNPDLGFSFSTYACPKINGAIRDGIRSENPLPKRLTTLARSAAAAEEALTQELSRTPTYSEIVAYLDTNSDHAALLPRLASAASLDELTDPWRETSREPACLVDHQDPQDETIRSMRIDAVRDAVAALPEDERLAMQMLHLEDRSLTETARLLGTDTRTLRATRRRAQESLALALTGWAPTLVSA